MQRVVGVVFLFFVFLSLWLLLQFVPLRRPRETVSSRQTTRLTAACTRTAKGAQCPLSTAGPTPALNRNPRSRPTERSCEWSPARLGRANKSFRTDSYLPTSPLPPDKSYLSALSPAFLYQSRRRAEDCVREMLSCIKFFYLHFSSWQASCHSFRGPAATPPKRGSTAALKDLILFKRQ